MLELKSELGFVVKRKINEDGTKSNIGRLCEYVPGGLIVVCRGEIHDMEWHKEMMRLHGECYFVNGKLTTRNGATFIWAFDSETNDDFLIKVLEA